MFRKQTSTQTAERFIALYTRPISPPSISPEFGTTYFWRNPPRCNRCHQEGHRRKHCQNMCSPYTKGEKAARWAITYGKSRIEAAAQFGINPLTVERARHSLRLPRFLESPIKRRPPKVPLFVRRSIRNIGWAAVLWMTAKPDERLIQETLCFCCPQFSCTKCQPKANNHASQSIVGATS